MDAQLGEQFHICAHALFLFAFELGIDTTTKYTAFILFLPPDIYIWSGQIVKQIEES